MPHGFDDQERNLTFAKTNFQILKLKFHACSMKQAFLLLHKLNIVRAWQHKNTFIQVFRSVPGCQTYMCKHGIRVKVKGSLSELSYSYNELGGKIGVKVMCLIYVK